MRPIHTIMGKKTLVIGASEKSGRYSNMAIRSLRQHGHEVRAFGLREGKVGDVEIFKDQKAVENLDTITLYVNPANQKKLYDYILSLQPKRIIFNPGTENPELAKLAADKNIDVEYACTLVMLSVGKY